MTNFNLERMLKRLPKLKAFGLAYKLDMPVIDNFPRQLEELEVIANNYGVTYLEDDEIVMGLRAIQVCGYQCSRHSA
jgi:hypothetical protein